MYENYEIKRSSNFGSNYWESFSPKLNRIVKFFTDLEYENWVLIETNPEVIEFCERPKEIKINCNSDDETPFDMWVKWKNNKQTFINIFYSSDLELNNKQYEKNIEFIKNRKNWCLNNNFDYEVVVDKDIRRSQIYLNNKKKILSNVRVNRNRNKSDIEKIFDIINTDKKSIKTIHEELSGTPLQRIANGICWLLYHGFIDGDLDNKALNLQTEVWKNGETQIF